MSKIRLAALALHGAWSMPVSALVLTLIYHLIFSPFYPNAGGSMGHDYGYFLSRLLDGYYWHLNNGVFSVQWFTAAFCGGVPAFANPLNPFFSVPQWLTLAVDPIRAVYLTHLTFALIGFTGFYLLLRRSFGTSEAVAICGAALFMFNGFHAYRMVIGHLSYHPFMLVPLVAYFLAGSGRCSAKLSEFVQASIAAVLLSYMVYAGMFHLVPQVVLILAFVGLLHDFGFGGGLRYWAKMAGAGALACVLSAPKLVAVFAFLGQFPRSDYPLPGIDSVWGLLALVFEALFLRAPADSLDALMVNNQLREGRHEIEFGVTFVPLVMLVTGSLFWLRKPVAQRSLEAGVRKALLITGMLLILAVPLALNVYTPAWNDFLKQLPWLRNSSTLLRMLCVYVPLAVLLGAIAFDRAHLPAALKRWAGAAAIVVVVASVTLTDKTYYHNESYDPQLVEEGYRQAQHSGMPPAILTVETFTDRAGRVQMPMFRNDVVALGGSQLMCYEPIFGYRLESLPFGSLQVGRTDTVLNGVFNLKNPACYVFPEENDCRPGEHFRAHQHHELVSITHYRPYGFRTSALQQAANATASVCVAALLILWTFCGITRLRNRWSSRGPGAQIL